MPRNRIFLSPPHMGGDELEYVKKAFTSNYIAPAGPMLNQLEKEFCEYTKIPYCVALSSGSAALHLALKNLNIKPGDKILASTLTFIGSVSSAYHMGAEICFIDSDVNTWNMDPKLLSQELEESQKQNNLPKAIIPTDLYGQSCDIDLIMKICKPYNIPVIIDSAEAVGAKYKERHAGNGADASIYSFNGNKIITSSGGGILASTNKKWIDNARFLATQARESVSYYEHKEVGFNYRLSNVCAAILCGQLEVIEERVKRKREIYHFYKRSLQDLPGIEFMPFANYGKSNAWLSVVLIDKEKSNTSNEKIRLALEEKNIESRHLWKPMHMQPVFKNCKIVEGDVAENLFAKGLCLPSGTSMTENDLVFVVDAIKECWI